MLTNVLILLTESGKRQTRSLVRESAPHQQACNCPTVKGSGLKPQMGDLLQNGLADGTAGRNIPLTLT
jgi:hypothetical protein